MNSNRFHLASILSLGCLALVLSVGACSGDNDRDNDNDRTPDAGDNTKPDAGDNTKPDAGDDIIIEEPKVGDSCEGGSANDPQGTCGDDQICENGGIFSGGYCTALCSSHDECGEDGVCVQVGTNPQTGGPLAICFRGCDESVANSCGRDGYTCAFGGLCVADCRANDGMCEAGLEQCNQTSGLCEPAPGSKEAYESCDTRNADVADNCVAGATCRITDNAGICHENCTKNADCSTDGSSKCVLGTTGEKLCAATCTSNDDCATGTTCNEFAGAKYCFAATGTIGHYGNCTAEPDQCIDGTLCLGVRGGNVSVCMQECTGGVACPANNRCAVSLPGNRLFCAQSCDPAAPVCPTGTTCQGTAPNALCMPS